jgi:hypothetical protein
VDSLLQIAASVPHNLPILGQLQAPDAEALRQLSFRIDAALVPHTLHSTAGFADLIAEVDP